MPHVPPPETKPSITIFFPAYNDEGSIAALVQKALALLPHLTHDYEVMVVNDGSRDGTAAVLEALAETEPKLQVIHHPHNRGYGGALQSGFLHATKDLVFYTDGDGQYDVDELAALLPLLSDDVDVVNGYKRKRADDQHRVVLGGLYKLLARTLFRLPIRDVDCDFRLLRRHAIQSIALHSTSGCICTEMVYKLHAAGYRFMETPVHHYARQHGQSQFFTWHRVARTASDFFALWLKLVVKPRLRFSPAAQRKQVIPERG